MTPTELRKLLDEYASKHAMEYAPADWYEQGFQEAVELLMPCLEALEYTIKESGTSTNYNLKCRQALADLELKLKEGK